MQRNGRATPSAAVGERDKREVKGEMERERKRENDPVRDKTGRGFTLGAHTDKRIRG